MKVQQLGVRLTHAPRLGCDATISPPTGVRQTQPGPEPSQCNPLFDMYATTVVVVVVVVVVDVGVADVVDVDVGIVKVKGTKRRRGKSKTSHKAWTEKHDRVRNQTEPVLYPPKPRPLPAALIVTARSRSTQIATTAADRWGTPHLPQGFSDYKSTTKRLPGIHVRE